MLVPKLYDILYMLNQKFSFKKNNDEFDVDKAVMHKFPFLLTHTKRYVTMNRLNKALAKLDKLEDGDLFKEGKFSHAAKSVLSPLFKDEEHLYSYIKTKGDMTAVINVVASKVRTMEKKVSPDTPVEIFETLGAS